MKTAIPINKKLFDIYLLFTREPFARYFYKELEFYSNGNGGLLGLISLDHTDKDYYGCILSRDKSRQYRATSVEASIPTIEEAREWIDNKMENDSIILHENKNDFFDLFQELNNEEKQHPHYKLLKNQVGLSSAKQAVKEISYHYKDIDGNFIEQFQSKNGFDSRVWELFLFCFFREQLFSFNRNFELPDYMIEKLGAEVAVEAVIISRKTEIKNTPLPQDHNEIQEKLKNDVPLLYGSALFSKLKKKYWEKEHVKGKPFAIAIADFHDTMSMTWSFDAISDYLYGYKYQPFFDENDKLIVKPKKIKDYIKPNGTKIPSGFFFQPNTENISAIIFSTCGTISKFNRMGKQADLGSELPILIRIGAFHNHESNAIDPTFRHYQVNQESNETWSEGVIIFHNPNAKYPIDPNLFDDKVAQSFFNLTDKLTYTNIPETFPYNSFTQNIIPKNDE